MTLQLDPTDPLTLALAGLAVALLLLIILIARGASQARALAQVSGALRSVSDAQAAGEARLAGLVEGRLGQVRGEMSERLADNALAQARTLAELQAGMAESLNGSSERTTRSLTELQERLAAIDRAQVKIEKLSGDVLGLQDILSNKQTRGAFGEIQLADILAKALPPDAYTLQAILTDGRRADCLIHLPPPTGPIVIDAKFPLEAYEALVAAPTGPEREAALKALATAVRTHLKAIAERYIRPGETADGALMFLPSEAVYAELHARLPHVVREGFALRVWIVSPTTCMATLNTMRAILRDARVTARAAEIRRELDLLHADMGRLGERVGKLGRHFDQARADLDLVATSAEKAGRRAGRLHAFDFDRDETAIPPGESRSDSRSQRSSVAVST